MVRLPDTADEPPGADLVAFDPDEIAQLVEESVGTSALFAARFRECAARALLLPRRDPRRRQPLWQQRQRSAQLLDVAREYADFPITLEAARECLQDVFDVPGLVGLMRDLAARKVRLVEVETPRPSPFARSLLFGYVGAFLYEGDAPLAERRAAALALDSTLLGELLGRVDLRELLDPAVVAETEQQLQWLTGERAPARRRGRRPSCCACSATCPTAELPRARRATAAWLAELEPARRAIRVRDRRRGALDRRSRTPAGSATRSGWPCRSACPRAYLEPVADPLGDLVARYARTHGPFAAADLRGPVRARRLRRRAGAASGSPPPAGSSPASSPRAAPAPSGATPRCCGCCAAGRWPRCAGRSSRCRRGCWPRSCPAGSRSARNGPRRRGGRRRDRAAAGRARCPRPRWSGWCCRPGSPTTPRPTSTSCAPPARWSGPAPARSPAATAG